MKDILIVLAILAGIIAAWALFTTARETVGPVLVLGLFLAAYLLPWIVAAARKHHNVWAIFMLNLALGWTFLGWVWALVWAFMNPSPAAPQAPSVPSPAAARTDPGDQHA
ncbi:MAG: superinfection immunity protein [Nitrococcus mobilis]|nr:superinfection immunity protein [Nitrococcus mobilis]